MPFIDAEGVTKTYSGGKVLVKAVNNLSLSVEKGTFTAIIGRSGSGKSTLLHSIGGLEKPDSGRIILEGVELTQLNDAELTKIRRRKIGFVFQSFYLLPEFTVLENILIPAYLDDKEPDMEYIEELLDSMNLTDKKDAFPNELSGGEQQRAAIARALCVKPEVLLADEPTGNLDVKSGQEVMNLLKLLQKKTGQTILMVTHDLSLARQADRIIKLEDGQVLSDLEG